MYIQWYWQTQNLYEGILNVVTRLRLRDEYHRSKLAYLVFGWLNGIISNKHVLLLCVCTTTQNHTPMGITEM